MEIIIPQKELHEAFSSLSRISGIVRPARPEFHSIRLQSQLQNKERTIVISATDFSQSLHFTLPNAHAEADFDIILDSRELQGFVKACGKTGYLTFTLEGGTIKVLNQDRQLGVLNLLAATEVIESPQIPKLTHSIVLPTNFPTFLSHAQSCASTDPKRPVLQSINISPEGITSTCGKSLFHLQLPFAALPWEILFNFNRVLRSIKQRWLTLRTWKNSDVEPALIAIHGENFFYTTTALNGVYPDWKQVLPDDSQLNCRCKLSTEDRELLKNFLEQPETKTGEYVDVITEDNLMLVTNAAGRKLQLFNTEIRNGSHPGKTSMKASFLLQMLKFGHTTLLINTHSDAPIKATGGTGVFIFMACKREQRQTQSQEEKITSPAPESDKTKAVPESESPTAITTTNNNPTTGSVEPDATNKSPEKPNQTKEIRTMTQAIEMTNINTLPQENEELNANPLEDANQVIETLRDEIKNLDERLLSLGRNLKKAQMLQRQKERQYTTTSRRLECIRQASGF